MALGVLVIIKYTMYHEVCTQTYSWGASAPLLSTCCELEILWGPYSGKNLMGWGTEETRSKK